MTDEEIAELAKKHGYWNENAAWEFQPWELENFVKELIDRLEAKP